MRFCANLVMRPREPTETKMLAIVQMAGCKLKRRKKSNKPKIMHKYRIVIYNFSNCRNKVIDWKLTLLWNNNPFLRKYNLFSVYKIQRYLLLSSLSNLLLIQMVCKRVAEVQFVSEMNTNNRKLKAYNKTDYIKTVHKC